MKVFNALLITLTIFQITSGQFTQDQKQQLLEEINKNPWRKHAVCSFIKSEYITPFNEEAKLDREGKVWLLSTQKRLLFDLFDENENQEKINALSIIIKHVQPTR